MQNYYILRVNHLIGISTFACSLFISIAVFIGWLTGALWLRTLDLSPPSMFPYEALILSLLATIGLLQFQTKSVFHTILNNLSILSFFLISITLVQSIFHIFSGTESPSLESLIALIAIQLSIWPKDFKIGKTIFLDQILLLFTAGIGLIFLTRFLWDTRPMNIIVPPESNTGIAFPTALCLLLLSIGYLTSRPNRGFMALFV